MASRERGTGYSTRTARPAMVAMLIGCGLRRATGPRVESMQHLHVRIGFAADWPAQEMRLWYPHPSTAVHRRSGSIESGGLS